MNKLYILLIILMATSCSAENFSEIILKNTLHIEESKDIRHENGPVAITKGTGFVVKIHNKNYIITAKHIVNDLENDQLIVEKYESKTIRQFEVPIKHNNKPLWISHKTKDIAIIPTTIESSINETNLDLEQQVSFGSYALTIGFPKGTYEARMKGGNISFNILKHPIEEIFFDARITQGESGSPVFVSTMNKIVGVLYGEEEDLKIADVVPICFLKDLLNE